MWNKIAEDSQKEEKLQIKEAEEGLELMAGASGSRKVDDGQTEPKEKAEYERSMVTSILRTILDELSKVGEDITDLVKIFDETADDEQLSRELNVKFVVKSKLREMAQGTGSMWSGEWISVAIGKVLQNSEKTKFRCVNSLLKLILYKIVPYDLSFPAPTRKDGVGTVDIEQEKAAPIPPQSADVRCVESSENVEAAAAVTGSEVILSEVVGHKSKLSVGKYTIKSKVEMRDGREKRVWPCPYGDCEQKFGSSRKCGAHLNEHLNRIYECPTCKYRLYSLDGYEHHICFKGPKTQGERKVREKRKTAPEPEGGHKRKWVATSTVSKPRESEQSSASSLAAVVIQKDDEPDLIVLE